VWKERYVGALAPLTPLLWDMFVVGGSMCLVAVAALPLLILLAAGLHHQELGPVVGMTNIWSRVVGGPVACLLLLRVAVRAAGSLTGEREARTLDGLLATPLGDREIVREVWLGSILNIGPLAWFLAAAWGVGLLTGGISPLSLPLLAAAWSVYAAFAAALGLWCSLRCRTTWRATGLTAALLLAVTVGHWLVHPAEPLFVPSTEDPRWLDDFHWYALSPPASLDALTFPLFPSAWYGLRHGSRLANAVLGVGLYALAALLLYRRVLVRFGPVTGRMPEAGGRPERKYQRGATPGPR
jgi:hypothetical protein